MFKIWEANPRVAQFRKIWRALVNLEGMPMNLFSLRVWVMDVWP